LVLSFRFLGVWRFDGCWERKSSAVCSFEDRAFALLR
jgi:hypothetical protein